MIYFDPAMDGPILGRDIREAIAQPLNLEDPFAPAGDLLLPVTQHGSRFGEHNLHPDIEIRTGRCAGGLVAGPQRSGAKIRRRSPVGAP